MTRSILSVADLSKDELLLVLDRAKAIKSEIRQRKDIRTLHNRIVGLIFEKPSTRTRASFELATLRLGGQALYLASTELQLSRGEPVKDTARILGGYVDALVARVFAHNTVTELAKFSGVPVINGLSDLEHPTQTICDLFTILEAKGKLRGLTLAYIGDGNNVCNSLLLGAALTGMNMTAACPDGYHPNQSILGKAQKIAQSTGATLNVVRKPEEAAKKADVLYTDVWVSMGEEKQAKEKNEKFGEYQINADLLKVAASDASVMHCLPAHRGLEITDEVLEGKQSIAWTQGNNKLYGAAATLEFFLQHQ